MKNKPDKASAGEGRSGLSRRAFLAGTGGGALSFGIMKPGLARGSQVSSKISLGLIGCGSRGTWIADLFQKHGGYQITAAHDYFPDRVNAFGDKFNLPAARRFTGLKGYQRMLEAKVDAVAIESPPYFHHEQAAAAVEAGVNVYLAKPMAVDVPGCRSIEASAKRAEEKKLAYLIDFQTRTDPFYQEAIRRVQKEAQHWPHRQWRSVVCRRSTLGENDSGLGGESSGSRTPPARVGTEPGALRRHHHRAEHPLD